MGISPTVLLLAEHIKLRIAALPLAPQRTCIHLGLRQRWTLREEGLGTPHPCDQCRGASPPPAHTAMVRGGRYHASPLLLYRRHFLFAFMAR